MAESTKKDFNTALRGSYRDESDGTTSQQVRVVGGVNGDDVTITDGQTGDIVFLGATGGDLTTDPGALAYIVGHLHIPSHLFEAISVSAAGTLTLSSSSIYVFTGTTTTWTLPALSTKTGATYRIKNRGSGAITLNRAGSDELYTTSAVTSLTINAGESYDIIGDGTYWIVM